MWPRLVASTTFASVLAASSAFALESGSSRSKYALNVAGVATPNQDKGWIVDVQYVHYLPNSYMIWGFEGSYGSPIPTSGNALMAGGVLLGVEAMFKWGVLLGGTVSVDAAQATQYGNVVGPTLVGMAKPQAFLGFNLGGGFRLAFSGGYLVVSNVPQFSGPIAGLRIDYKMETVTKPVED